MCNRSIEKERNGKVERERQIQRGGDKQIDVESERNRRMGSVFLVMRKIC